MIHNVVVPLDGSAYSERALPVGNALAHAADAKVTVLGVAPSGAEHAWFYDRVTDAATRAGVGPAAIDVRVDPDPVLVLLEVASDHHNVLCLATHDRMRPATKVRHAVGSRVLDRSRHPLVVVGPHASTDGRGTDVVVALDGTTNAEPLLAVASSWALQLRSRLRLVTVYEPTLSDLRRPQHFTRALGPPCDPGIYLDAMRERVADVGLDRVDTVAIPDPVSVTAGLEHHLADAPARLLVLGGGHTPHPTPSGGVARSLLHNLTIPLLIVNRTT